MTSKKKNKTTTADNLPALRIGSRVRYRDDGVAGRIVWANAVSLKIEWDDGEQVTWRRDSLSERPIDIVEDADDKQGAEAMATATELEQFPPPDTLSTKSTTASEDGQATPAEEASPNTESIQEPTLLDAGEEEEAKPSAPTDAPPTQQATATPDWQTLLKYEHAEDLAEALFEVESTALAIAEEKAAVAEPIAKTETPTMPKEKKRSALDAAALVLAEEGKPMNCQELIAAMAARSYWNSPKGRTPQATLYSALTREITVKGIASRFVKAERGKFALANGQ